MKTIETVYNKLNTDKTELATHKVELSALDDIKKAISEMKKMEKDATKIYDNYESKLSDAIRAYRKLNDERNIIYGWTYSEAPAIIKDVAKIAKELGIDVNQIPEIKELNKYINTGKELVKEIDKYKEPKF